MPQAIRTDQLPIYKDYPSNISSTVVRPIEFVTLVDIVGPSSGLTCSVYHKQGQNYEKIHSSHENHCKQLN